MSYSNDQIQIKAGLINYVGALLSASPYDGTSARHNVVSALSEQILKLGKDKDGALDMYSLKPMIRATNIVIAERCSELQEIDSSKYATEIGEYKDILIRVKDLIDSIEKDPY